MWDPERIALDLCTQGHEKTAAEFMHAVDLEEKMMLWADAQPTAEDWAEAFGYVGTVEYKYDEEDEELDFRY